MEPRRFITAITKARHLFLSWARSIQSMPPHPTTWRSILILTSHLRLCLSSGLFPSLPSPKPYMNLSCLPYITHAPPIPLPHRKRISVTNSKSFNFAQSNNCCWWWQLYSMYTLGNFWILNHMFYIYIYIYIVTTAIRGRSLWMNFAFEAIHQDMQILHQKGQMSCLTCSLLFLLLSTFSIVSLLC